MRGLLPVFSYLFLVRLYGKSWNSIKGRLFSSSSNDSARRVWQEPFDSSETR